MTIDNQRSTESRLEQEYDEPLRMEQCDCCRFIRTFSPSFSRVLLPLARRGRPYISNRSHRLLCPNCHKLKQQLQTDILNPKQTHLPPTPIDNSSKTSTSDLHHLTDQERKMLLEELIRKLQIVLNNHPTINNYDENNFQLTYRTLQTTLSLLSSSHDPV